MAGLSGRWLLTASFAAILMSPIAAFSQAGRPWVDPPPETGAKPPVPAPSPAPPTPQAAAPSPASPPQQAATSPSQPDVQKADVASQPAPEVKERKAAANNQVKQKPVAERKSRASSQQANSSARSQKRNGQLVRRRETSTQISQAEPRSGVERRARISRYGTIQEGLDSGLQLMRLRTIQLPDGRRIEVLTRPDQDIASQLPDGY